MGSCAIPCCLMASSPTASESHKSSKPQQARSRCSSSPISQETAREKVIIMAAVGTGSRTGSPQPNREDSRAADPRDSSGQGDSEDNEVVIERDGSDFDTSDLDVDHESDDFSDEDEYDDDDDLDKNGNSYIYDDPKYRIDNSLDDTPSLPRTPGDILAVSLLLRRLDLPDELIKDVLHFAAYDGITFRATSHDRYLVHPRGSDASVRNAYIVTSPLRYLVRRQASGEEEVAEAYADEDPQRSRHHLSGFSGRGRVTRVRLAASARSQGHGSFPYLDSFTWFEVAKFNNGSLEETYEPVKWGTVDWQGKHEWAINRIASVLLEHFEHGWTRLALHFDANATEPNNANSPNGSDELANFLKTLVDGDRLCIIPVAQDPDWYFEVRAAKIEVFVEIYR